MKKTLSLIIASFMAVSLMGQIAKNNIPGHEVQIKTEALEGENGRPFDLGNHQPSGRIKLQAMLKSAPIVKQQLDSVIGETPDPITGELVISGKIIYTNDANGNIIQSIEYATNEDTHLIFKEKHEYAYGSNGNQTQSISYNWDQIARQWIGFQKVDSTYDANGHVTQFASYNWNQSVSQWVGSKKEEKNYNSNGQLTQSITYGWDKSVSQWVASQKDEKTYDSSGQLTQRVTYGWDKIAGLWNIGWRWRFTYDNGNVTEEIVDGFDIVSNQWFLVAKIEQSYNSNGIQNKSITYRWNSADQRWDEYDKIESSYNSNGELTQTTESSKGSSGLLEEWKCEYSYDSSGNQVLALGYYSDSGQWILDYKYEFICDSNGNRTQVIHYNWDEITSQWISVQKNEDLYDLNGNQTLRIRYKWDGQTSQWVFRTKNESTYYSNGNLKQSIDFNNQLLITNNITWYYSEVETSSTVNISTDELKTFPNPASEFLTFGFNDDSHPASLELFNMQGEMVIAQIIPPGKRIQVSQLRHGVYLYRVDQNNKIFKGKIVIK